MAEIVLGMWTTHGPTLSTTPEEWLLRLPADHANKQHPFRGGKYDFETLVKLRKDEADFASMCTLEERTKRYAVKPDVVVIFGNDQEELFLPKLMPAYTIFNGPTIWNEPATPEQAKMHPPGIHAAEWGHKPSEYTEYPGHPELANKLIGSLVDEGFDITRANELPHNEGNWHSGIGHAFGFIYRQIMRDKVVPNVPIITNTFFPPNQPKGKRCFELGRAVGRALRDWDSDARVAVFGSGGMSHFVIDESLDHKVLDALAARDSESLLSIPESSFQSGSSELKNWLAAAGVLFDTKLSGGVIDYVPCYRSEAGTGTANGFVAWK
jgi:hypothetical protein